LTPITITVTVANEVEKPSVTAYWKLSVSGSPWASQFSTPVGS